MAEAEPVIRAVLPDANVPGGFTGKELHVRAGHSLSMQYHEQKEEVLAVRSGRIRLEIGPSVDELDRDVYATPIKFPV